MIVSSFSLIFFVSIFLYYKSVSITPGTGFDAVKSWSPIKLYVYLLKGGNSNLISKESNSLLALALNTPFSCQKVSMLLHYGADPNLVHDLGYNAPLLDAASWLDYCSVKLLLESGADINYRDKNNHSVYDYLGNGNDKESKKIINILEKYRH